MNPAELFRQDSNTLKVEAGETLFRTGDPATEMFVILDGTLDIMVGSECVESAGSGSLVGEMALIDDATRGATVVAKTPATLARIDKRRFHFLVQQNPFFATHVMKVLAERIRHMNQRVAAG